MSDLFDDGEIVAEGIIQASTLQQYVDTLRALVDECRVHFTDGGLTTAAIDTATVAAYPETDLNKSAFESYESPGQVRIGVNLTRLDEKLGSANSDDLIHFGIDMETRHLRFRYRQIEHEMALIDPEAIRGEPDKPDLDLPNYVEIPAERIQEACKNIDYVSDHVEFDGDPDAEVFRLVGVGDTDRTVATFDEDDCRRIEMQEDVESLFSLAYLADVSSEIPKDAVVGIEFGDEYPTYWTWEMCDGGIDAEFTLAPRIRSD
jgi:proliferating cell nuclear antigen